MSRIISDKEIIKRRRFANKAAKIEEKFNELIQEAYKAGISSDIRIWVMTEVCRPVVKIWFFRDSGSIQNE